ncbi:MAG: MFS transporter [Lentisphaeria bacterium]|nr:MFS transporter [Lentisphaeria bacterium]
MPLFLLLPVIYLAFISLGLPDALLGAAWPELHPAMGVSFDSAGIITFIISCGTVVSSLMSDTLNRRFGTGLLTAGSVLLTAVALLGFSVSDRFWMLCCWAVPYGIGAGGVDAALNNYVALHYTSRHMNWLHCFWGVGVAISPYIMSGCLQHQLGWQAGYRIVGCLQVILVAVLLLSLPLWRKATPPAAVGTADRVPCCGVKAAWRIPGVPMVLLGFFCYCAMEHTAILWSCSYLAFDRGMDPAMAARWGAMFFIGILTGRFLSGFCSNRVGDRWMIRIGVGLVLIGLIGVMLPVEAAALGGLLLLGFGCAPIYPAIIHATPANFGAENSQAIVGIQMASAYTGATITPPVFGWLAQRLDLWIFPFFLLLFVVPMLLALERLNRIVDRRGR